MRTTTAEEQDAGAGALPGRSWSGHAQIAARAGLDLGGTAIALVAFAVALAGGPGWLITLLAAWHCGRRFSQCRPQSSHLINGRACSLKAMRRVPSCW